MSAGTVRRQGYRLSTRAAAQEYDVQFWAPRAKFLKSEVDRWNVPILPGMQGMQGLQQLALPQPPQQPPPPPPII